MKHYYIRLVQHPKRGGGRLRCVLVLPQEASLMPGVASSAQDASDAVTALNQNYAQPMAESVTGAGSIIDRHPEGRTVPGPPTQPGPPACAVLPCSSATTWRAACAAGRARRRVDDMVSGARMRPHSLLRQRQQETCHG
ncbi:hypothetical protein AQPW35_00010 [Rubrivivax pictus]|uniref:Uncharacterized protein n=1 Tax=Pseudaquabacterium pictum TaxID=2315236 RepID=A0A480AJP5_9BURK|nr:hypothetical protein AQPW35_00010 [Rubrivivax pictus]